MPAGNVAAPVIEIGGDVRAGPANAAARAGIGTAAGDNHGTAAWLLVGLAVLILLHRARFRFSQTVG